MNKAPKEYINMLNEFEEMFDILFEMQEKLSREGSDLYQKNSIKDYTYFKGILKSDKDFSQLLYSFHYKFQSLVMKLLESHDLCTITQGHEIDFKRFDTPFTYSQNDRKLFHRESSKLIRYSYLYY